MAIPATECNTRILAGGKGVVLTQFPRRRLHRWDEKAGLRRDAIRSQWFDALEAQPKGDRL